MRYELDSPGPNKSDNERKSLTFVILTTKGSGTCRNKTLDSVQRHGRQPR